MVQEHNTREDSTQEHGDPKRLFRSIDDRIIAGVCGGVAEFYGISSLGVRIVFILLTLLNGIGLVLYLIGAFLVPNGSGSYEHVNNEGKAKEFVGDMKKGAEKITSQFQGMSAPGDKKDIFKTILIVIVAILFLNLLPGYLVWIAPELILIIAIILIASYLIRSK